MKKSSKQLSPFTDMSINNPPVVMAVPYSPSQMAAETLEESGSIFEQVFTGFRTKAVVVCLFLNN